MTTPVPLDAQTMKRLAFIRLLHQQGIDQTRLPEPLTFTAVLSFHDAAEHFLILAGEHLGASLPDHTPFMKYFAELHPRKLDGGVDLSGKVGLDRLNRLRNNFKHAGTPPGSAGVEQARADVAAFFEDNTPRVFGIAYDGIDMADLIPQPEARQKTKEAAVASAAGNQIEGMALLVEAFDGLFAPHRARHQWEISPFSFGERISYPMRSTQMESIFRHPDSGPYRWSNPGGDARRLAEQIDWVTRTAREAQGALRIIALGIDYGRYHRFRQLTPRVSLNYDETREVFHDPDYAPTVAEFDFCRQFLITVALQLAEVEAHLVPPSWAPIPAEP